jgi:hypothetical protein
MQSTKRMVRAVNARVSSIVDLAGGLKSAAAAVLGEPQPFCEGWSAAM